MQQTYVIAEAGVNHNGSVERALDLIDAAAEAGADAVKFQTFRTGELVTKAACKAEYQAALTDSGEDQWSMLKTLELDADMHHRLMEHCQQKGVDFLSTPFDLPSLEFLAGSLKLPVIKISSGDITNAPLLYRVAALGRNVVLSTGMSTLAEVEAALAALAFGYTTTVAAPSSEGFRTAYASSAGQQAVQDHVTLLHCTTEYPSPFDEVNLRVLETMRMAFQLPVGLSDHTPGVAVPIAAVALGAAVIEKHFTLDKRLPGPDHQASLEPAELSQMVQSIRQVEQALGRAVKLPTPTESKNIAHVRKSLVARTPIQAGETYTEANLTCKRPGEGISPMRYWDYIGKTASRSYSADDPVGES